MVQAINGCGTAQVGSRYRPRWLSATDLFQLCPLESDVHLVGLAQTARAVTTLDAVRRSLSSGMATLHEIPARALAVYVHQRRQRAPGPRDARAHVRVMHLPDGNSVPMSVTTRAWYVGEGERGSRLSPYAIPRMIGPTERRTA